MIMAHLGTKQMSIADCSKMNSHQSCQPCSIARKIHNMMAVAKILSACRGFTTLQMLGDKKAP